MELLINVKMSQKWKGEISLQTYILLSGRLQIYNWDQIPFSVYLYKAD